MSQKLLNRNPILQRFANDGLNINIKNQFLILNDIPYVSKDKNVKYGKIISALILSGEKVIKPKTHVVYFAGEFPCNQNGESLNQLRYDTLNKEISENIFVNYSFSNRTNSSYDNEYEKVINYVNIITGPVHLIDESISPYNFKIPEFESKDEDYAFAFLDTNSSRGNFSHINNKLSELNIGIIGLGGTGSYILDLVVKTPVKSIYLFDSDRFNSHNAFRAPGSPSIDQLNKNMYKVEYFTEIYSRMHKNIFPVIEKIDVTNLNLLEDLNFIFLNIDASEDKKDIINFLFSRNIPFIDSGIDVSIRENSLAGTIRNTFVHKESSERWKNIISYTGLNQQYESNIQIAELNNLAAVFSVIQWKKYYGFYCKDKCFDNKHYIVEAGESINDN